MITLVLFISLVLFLIHRIVIRNLTSEQRIDNGIGLGLFDVICIIWIVLSFWCTAFIIVSYSQSQLVVNEYNLKLEYYKAFDIKDLDMEKAQMKAAFDDIMVRKSRNDFYITDCLESDDIEMVYSRYKSFIDQIKLSEQ